MVSCLRFKSLRHFEFIFLYGERVCGCPTFPIPLASFIKDWLIVGFWVYFWALHFYSIDPYVCFCTNTPSVALSTFTLLWKSRCFFIFGFIFHLKLLKNKVTGFLSLVYYSLTFYISGCFLDCFYTESSLRYERLTKAVFVQMHYVCEI